MRTLAGRRRRRATAASASGRVNRPRRAPCRRSRPRSPRPRRPRPARPGRRAARCPPEAITGAAVAAATSRSSSRFGPVQRAVLADVGDDVAGAAVAVQPGEGLPEVAAVACVQPRAASRCVAVGRSARRARRRSGRRARRSPRAHHSRVLQRGGAEVDPRAAGGERPVERGVVADAAGQLDRDVQLADDRGEQLGVGAAAERGVEVDEVDPLGAVALPGQRGVAAGRRRRSRCRPRPAPGGRPGRRATSTAGRR